MCIRDRDIQGWLSLNVGMRIDYHSHVGTEWVLQGGLAFHLPGNAEMKMMVSKGFRNPTICEMYMFCPANPELFVRGETCWHNTMKSTRVFLYLRRH